MPDPKADDAALTDLPLQPTGSGVADLEIAYEQMRLAGSDEDVEAENGLSPQPLDEPEAVSASDESQAHPS